MAVDQQRHWRHGVEAVVDKDLASAVLAIKIRADWLLLLTGGLARSWRAGSLLG